MLTAEWTLPALRKTAGALLNRKEYEELSILAWDESWNARPGWVFADGTVARYRNGLLLVRAAEDVSAHDLLRHELGHHVTLHNTGRYRRTWDRLMCADLSGEALRGLCEGLADRICEEWGGVPNPAYRSRAQREQEFGRGYEQGWSVRLDR